MGGQVERRGEEPTLETKGQEPRQDRNSAWKKPEAWRAGEEDLATDHEFRRLTSGLLPPVGLSFLSGGPVHLFRMLMTGRRKVGGVNLRSSSASVSPQPPLLILWARPRASTGRGKVNQAGDPRSRCPSARRELTRSLGIYHAPNYNVNWQVPEIN